MVMNEVQASEGLLRYLIGDRLCAVTFIMDYIQFQFDNSHLTVLNPIVVEIDTQKYKIGDLLFRNSLCERILHNVENVILSNKTLQVYFDDSAVFLISLREEDYSGPEALNFNFWQNGKEIFVVE